MPTIYFEAQTGIIREALPSHSNFYQYTVSSSDRPVLEAAVEAATFESTHLQYAPGFLNRLEEMELAHRRQLVRENRPAWR